MKTSHIMSSSKKRTVDSNKERFEKSEQTYMFDFLMNGKDLCLIYSQSVDLNQYNIGKHY